MLKRTKMFAVVAGLALLASACGSGGSGGDDNSADKSGKEGGSFSYAIGEPSALFPPQACYASECSSVLSALYAGLVEMKDDKLVYRIAKSIESDDQIVWTVSLKDNFTFHNGEPVNADAYLRAWNWAANPDNGAVTAGFFTRIKGSDELKAGKAKTLSGLKKIDDYTFEVTLNAPFSQFPFMLLYKPAFAAVTQKCLDNIDACNEGKMPIGTGPFQMKGTWKHNDKIVVTKWADYAGKDAAHADKVTFQIYDKMETAFRDYQAGNLDIVEPISEQVQQARQAAGDRVIEADASDFTYIGLPLYIDYLKDPKVRHALSLAIDRQALIDNLLAGLGTPAQSVTTPIVPGGGGDHCDYCEYDPKRAKKMMPDGALPDTVTLWVNSGAGNDEWVQAVGNMWSKAFGVKFDLKTLQFPEYLKKLGKSDVTGPYRLGWIMDYPAMVNYLKPIYFKDAPTNYADYYSKKFESLVSKGSAAPSQDKAIDLYTQAEELLIEDMPVIPVYYGKAFYVYSKNVSNVTYNPLSRIDVSKVTVN